MTHFDQKECSGDVLSRCRHVIIWQIMKMTNIYIFIYFDRRECSGDGDVPSRCHLVMRVATSIIRGAGGCPLPEGGKYINTQILNRKMNIERHFHSQGGGMTNTQMYKYAHIS